jgi:hypothetical protein
MDFIGLAVKAQSVRTRKHTHSHNLFVCKVSDD